MATPSNALAIQDKVNPLVKVNLRDVQDVAGLIFQSRTYGDIKSKEEAAIKIIAGTEYGFDPFQSMTMIDFIQGRPTLNAHAKATLINSSGKYRLNVLELSNKVCKIELQRKDGEKWVKEQVFSFTWEDAVQAELTTGKNAHTWKKYPRNMLFARCVSNIWRWGTADLNTMKLQPSQIEEYEAPPALIAEKEGAEDLDESAETVDVDTGNDENAVTVAEMEDDEPDAIEAEIIDDDEPEPAENPENVAELVTRAVELLNAKTDGDEAAMKKILKGRQPEMMRGDALEKLIDELSAM